MTEDERPEGNFEPEWFDADHLEIRLRLHWTAGPLKGERTLCGVTYEALADGPHLSEIKDPKAVFNEHRKMFTDAIDRKIKANDFEPDGSVLVRSRDVSGGGGGFSDAFSNDFEKGKPDTTKQTELQGEPFSDGTYFSDRTGFDEDGGDLGRAGALSDTIYDTEDKLQFSARAKTFAKLIADESLRLPLAIGLFGNWGSGKSFFMSLVKNTIDDITKTARMPDAEPSTYLPRIAQIEFNAWHYMDTNLWASMAARIYEGLMEELAGSKKSITADVRAFLRADIRSSKLQIKGAEADRKIAIEQQAEAMDALERLNLEKDDAENKLGKKLIEILKKDESRKAAIKKLEGIAKELGFSKTIQSAQDVENLITEFEHLAAIIHDGHRI